MMQLSRCFHFVLILSLCSPTTPTLPKQDWFGLFPLRSPLLGESLLFSSPPPTKMFQFNGFASWIAPGYQAFNLVGCPIRRSADHRLCAPPRSFSQLVASFFASESLGIRRAPFFTFFNALAFFSSSLSLVIQYVNDRSALLLCAV